MLNLDEASSFDDKTPLRSVTALQDLELIHQLAHKIWWPTYQDYLDPLQIETMLADMYSVDALLEQQAAGVHFTIWEWDEQPAGFVGFGLKDAPDSDDSEKPDPLIMRIEKLYLLPEAQGFGGGRLLMKHVEEEARAVGATKLELNVNRHNPAQLFYRRQGFMIVQEVDIPYEGFFLNDFIMQKAI